ncbi:hypothetical protein [Paracoccus cavernae]
MNSKSLRQWSDAPAPFEARKTLPTIAATCGFAFGALIWVKLLRKDSVAKWRAVHIRGLIEINASTPFCGMMGFEKAQCRF